MVLIMPYRPSVDVPPQVSPTNVSLRGGNMQLKPTAMDVAVPGGRTSVLESHFGGGFSAIDGRFNWQFNNLTTDSNGNTPSVTDAGTMSGWGASDITFPATSLPTCRAFGNFYLPGGPYDEGWLTVDYFYVSPFGLPKGLKQIGLYSVAGEGSRTGPFPSCNTGWSVRLMQRGPGRANNAANINGDMYHYWTQNDQDSELWASGASNYEVSLGAVWRIETYFKLNTAFNLSNGIIRQKADPGTSTAHATPTTIRAEITNLQMYCGSEGNRANSLIDRVTAHTFFGGNDSTWQPGITTTMRYGRIAFEVPA